jgi:hypothetical protein
MADKVKKGLLDPKKMALTKRQRRFLSVFWGS